jgi:hypothetical protein
MKGILLPAYIENITTRKDKTVKITIGSQELSQGNAGELFSLLNNLAVVYISMKEIDQKEIDQVDKVNPDLKGKTQSQRIRDVLYILFTQDNEGFGDFDAYYKNKTEKYIEHLKSKIKD